MRTDSALDRSSDSAPLVTPARLTNQHESSRDLQMKQKQKSSLGKDSVSTPDTLKSRSKAEMFQAWSSTPSTEIVAMKTKPADVRSDVCGLDC